MNMKHRLIFLILLLCIFVLCGCYASDTSYESSLSPNSNIGRYDSIIKMASFAKSQNDKGSLQLGYVIKKDNLEDLVREKDEEIISIFDDENYCYYKLSMKDDNTVIIQKAVIFQSVVGYVATKNDTLNTRKAEGFEDPVTDAPSQLGYDSDLIVIDGYIGEFDGWNLYSYGAGM